MILDDRIRNGGSAALGSDSEETYFIWSIDNISVSLIEKVDRIVLKIYHKHIYAMAVRHLRVGLGLSNMTAY